MNANIEKALRTSPGYVLVHPERGVYLGNCLGFGFWSKWDPVGQDCAIVFPTQLDANEHAWSWEGDIDPLVRVHPITADVHHDGAWYASVDACVKSGLDAWDPHAVPDDARS